MHYGIFAATRKGAELALQVRDVLCADIAAEADVFVKKKIASDDMQWMIKDKYTGNIVGGIRLYDVDINNKCASVSYIQSRSSCGNGYMTESLVAMLKFAEQHGFEIIYTY